MAFRSHTDWRLRALSATNLLMRVNNVYTNSEEVRDSGYIYVIPKNLLKKFVCISDLKVQVLGYLFGIVSKDGAVEVRSIVMVPQVGSRDGVTVPSQMPESEYLRGLEPLGWIHTSP